MADTTQDNELRSQIGNLDEARSQQSQLMRSFPCFTNGEHPALDALGIVVEIFDGMTDKEVRAALGYLNARFKEGRDDG